MEKNKNKGSLWELFLVSSKLGLTSFGGPIAHLGYFFDEYVKKRKWISEKNYAELVALCQFLPGPASSQVGIGIGVMRARVIGGIVSFIGFTLPSVIALTLFAMMLKDIDINNAGWIHGLKIVAVAVIAQAIFGMAGKLAPDLKRKAIVLGGLVVTLLWQTAYSQIAVILISAIIGLFYYNKQKVSDEEEDFQFPLSRRFGAICLTLFFILLITLPIMKNVVTSPWFGIFDSFYRSGSLVFGGGHVVLPLLEKEFVPEGLVSKETFLAGYGATQAVPGPLFTFGAYLGAVMKGWTGGLLAAFAIFLPAFLLVFGTLPFWNLVRRHPKIKGALTGVNAAVVGILISAFYDPVWTSSILKPADFVVAALLFSLLMYWKLSPWIVVVIGGVGGILFL
ncbi:chromate transporter [Fictibacillus fluitans]|uniref:Chromate transporter n=1 Tax=Fictibacillus fluitans TaxID=3058422 RepID=A0ABT8HYN2_9BACL|nr:chromate transporter [Fictibacillus sp. NE201]MDN4525886.1 chromate transporter [Fictibacillus sp. NE201]